MKQKSGIYLEWDNVSIDVPINDGKSYKRIVHKSSGFLRPGEFVGIIGPSGAGKTTLLNYLS